jgi:hypothetical protein
MRINVYEDGNLIKVIPMNYESVLEIQYSHDYDNEGRYKVLCDNHEITLDGWRRSKSRASQIITHVKDQYEGGQSELDIFFGELS